VVKVTDFGLAKSGTLETRSQPHPTGEDDLASDHSGALTETGIVMGTPRYMAPEQHRGEALRPAADQYAFCVALWEALAGAAPFDETRLAAAKAEGPPSWPGGPTPRRIVAAIVRGLSPDPEERWPSMDALVERLAHDPARTRRRWVL